LNKYTLGWREWVELPELAIGPIKAKVDTGARTSALHTVNLDVFDRDGSTWVSFAFEHEDGSVGTVNEAPVLEFRDVTNSGGQSESRPVIQTPIKLGAVYKLVELTLTQRDNMAYRMLLGRTTLSSDFVVAPSESFVPGGDDTQPGTFE
jgi:hypothetical protein